MSTPNDPKWDRTNPTVPFLNNVMQSAAYRWNNDKIEWRNVPARFKCEMKIVGYESTNQSYAVRLQAPDSVVYRMPVADLFDILERSVVDHDHIPELEYKFSKQGSTYIIKVVWPDEV